MARELTFALGGATYAAAPTKVDRSKLYGWTRTVAYDDDGRECELASMDASGTFVIPAGGMGLGVLGPDQEWVERSALQAVRLDGSPAPQLASSFDAPVGLTQPVSPDDLLGCDVTAVYQLDGGESLATALGDAIYSFDYVYRAGYTSNKAFVLAADGNAFMLVGTLNTVEYVGLEQAEGVDEAAEDDAEEPDDIDFSIF